MGAEVPAYSYRSADFDPGSGDLPFLRELYASTRRAEVGQTGWPAEQIEEFLAGQFAAQHQHYQKHYPSAEFLVILGGDKAPIGRLYLDEWDDEFRIVDISLLPEWRGRGIGSRILAEVITRAVGREKMVSIHVEQFNPAMALYLRLGFEKIHEEGVYHLLRTKPKTSS